nr:MAG TPA: hypothetical protein [Caudoviricetes sp.]
MFENYLIIYSVFNLKQKNNRKEDLIWLSSGADASQKKQTN